MYVSVCIYTFICMYLCIYARMDSNGEQMAIIKENMLHS